MRVEIREGVASVGNGGHRGKRNCSTRNCSTLILGVEIKKKTKHGRRIVIGKETSESRIIKRPKENGPIKWG